MDFFGVKTDRLLSSSPSSAPVSPGPNESLREERFLGFEGRIGRLTMGSMKVNQRYGPDDCPPSVPASPVLPLSPSPSSCPILRGIRRAAKDFFIFDVLEKVRN